MDRPTSVRSTRRQFGCHPAGVAGQPQKPYDERRGYPAEADSIRCSCHVGDLPRRDSVDVATKDLIALQDVKAADVLSFCGAASQYRRAYQRGPDRQSPRQERNAISGSRAQEPDATRHTLRMPERARRPRSAQGEQSSAGEGRAHE